VGQRHRDGVSCSTDGHVMKSSIQHFERFLSANSSFCHHWGNSEVIYFYSEVT
jgi:hypothetical protein